MAGRVFTFADNWMMRAYFPHIASRHLAARMKRSICSISGHARLLRLRKTQIYLDSPDACRLRRDDNPGIAFQFRKGIVPANKGLRRPGYSMGRGRMAETTFKKGQQPRNTMPMWSFRFVDGYLMLKTGAPTPKPTTGWEYVHKLIWEHWNGPLPDWRVARIWWRDGDHGNCSLSNLELVGGRDHAMRTSIHNLPAPLKEVIQLKGALRRRIRRMENDAKELDGRPAQSPFRDDRSLAGCREADADRARESHL